MPPPSPGSASGRTEPSESYEPAVLSLTVTVFNVVLDSPLAAMPPPRCLATLCSISVSVAVIVPPTVRIPPPLPSVPDAEFSAIKESTTMNSPPSLKTPPPPSVSAEPLAVFRVISTLSILKYPEPFPTPPARPVAVLSLTQPSVNRVRNPWTMCSPPPLPGLGFASPLPATLFSR